MATLNDFKPYVLPEVPGVDVITAENHIRLAIKEFCEKSWVLKRAFSHYVAASDINKSDNNSVLVPVSGYWGELVPFWVARLAVDGQDWSVQHMHVAPESVIPDGIREDDHKMFYFHNASTLWLAPFDKACTLFLQVVMKPSAGAQTFDDALLNNWVEGIAAGAKAKLLAISGQPWFNPQMAEYYRLMFRNQIGEARVNVSKGYSSKSLSVHPREFGF